MEELINETIQKVFIDDSLDTLVFQVDSGKCLGYQTRNDCCNWVIFQEVGPISILTGAKVLEVKEKGVILGTFEGDVTDYYGITIKTTKGYADIVFRNEHNGYYGGSVVFIGNDSPVDRMQELKTDLI